LQTVQCIVQYIYYFQIFTITFACLLKFLVHLLQTS
jgi:hypothetical protein